MNNIRKRLLSVSLVAVMGLSSSSINVWASGKTAKISANETYEIKTDFTGDTGISMYRLYNPNSGEHFYTSNNAEKDWLVRTGWNYEGIGWVAPSKGQPVYRLYNPHAGDHHYTASANEKNSLKRAGWRDEGVGWYSGGNIPLYRQYNRRAKSGSHNYTTNKSENDVLVKAGWKSEGVGWYGIAKGKTIANNIQDTNRQVNSMIYLLWAATDYQKYPGYFWTIVGMATQPYYGRGGHYILTTHQVREVGYALSNSFNGKLPNIPKDGSVEKRGDEYYFYGGDVGGVEAELRNIRFNADNSVDVDLYEGLWNDSKDPYCHFHLVPNVHVNRQSVHPWYYSIASYRYLN